MGDGGEGFPWLILILSLLTPSTSSHSQGPRILCPPHCSLGLLLPHFPFPTCCTVALWIPPTFSLEGEMLPRGHLGSLRGCGYGQHEAWPDIQDSCVYVCVQHRRVVESPSCPGPVSCLSLSPLPPIAALGTFRIALCQLQPILLLWKL